MNGKSESENTCLTDQQIGCVRTQADDDDDDDAAAAAVGADDGEVTALRPHGDLQQRRSSHQLL